MKPMFSTTPQPNLIKKIEAWQRKITQRYTFRNDWHTGHLLAGNEFCRALRGQPVQFLATARDEVMAKRAFGNLTWVDIGMDSKAKKEFKAMFNSGDDSLLFDVQSCLDSGLKFSLSWDERRSAYRCTVVCSEPGNINQDKGFGSFAKTPLEALCVAAYKITTVTNGGEWTSTEEDDIG